MNESLQPTVLKDARQVNPFEIGSSEVDVKPTRWWQRVSRKPSLSAAERRDLLCIDTGDLSLERIKQYALDHAHYFEDGGMARYKGALALECQEAIKVRDWLRDDAHDRVAVYFLQRAKEQWTNRGAQQSGREERSIRLISGVAAALVPDGIIAQGDSAINEYLATQPTTRRLVFANDTTQMYLKQAAVLARIVVQQQNDE